MIKFVDLNVQYEKYKSEIDAAIAGVISSTAFINGPEVKSLEAELSSFCGAKHSIGCSSGTAALVIPQMAMEIKPGDEIIVPVFTYFASASMISHWGATPVFVDVEPNTFNIDPGKIEGKIGPKTKAIFAVSLYGQTPDLDSIMAIAEKHSLWVLEDGAQSFGAEYKDRRSCNVATVSTTSFFPAKPLGCYGDGGAIFTNDDEMADIMRKLVNHGQNKRYHHKYVGVNGRLDSIQASILRVKLKYFQEEITLRQNAAERYNEMLKDVDKVITPRVMSDRNSTWAQYTIRIPDRNRVRAALQEKGIPTSVHYPMPLNKQEAFAYLNDETEYKVAAELASEVLSLPMHAFITPEEQTEVVDSIKAVL